MQTNLANVSIADIEVEGRLRAVDPAWVEVIAGSMEQMGLRQPLVVRPHPHKKGKHLLIAGAHRLAAARLLEWTEIQADIQALDELSARLVEIDENLTRRELTALDRAIFMAERKRIYEELHPETKQGGDRKSKKSQDEIKSQDPATCSMFPRFTAATAKATGFSERAVQLLCSLVKSLSPDAIELLRATDLARNQSALLTLAEEEPAEQVALARLIASGESANLQQARMARGLVHTSTRDEQARAWAQFLALWEKANPRLRRQIREHVAGRQGGAISEAAE